MTSIRIKSSTTQDKVPVPADLATAELAVNIHEDSIALYTKDRTGAVREIGGGLGVVGDRGFWTREGTDLYPVNGNTDSVKIGGTLPAAPNISLNANGSGVFEGQVTAERVLVQGQTLSNVSTALVANAGTISDNTDLEQYRVLGLKTIAGGAINTPTAEFRVGRSVPGSDNANTTLGIYLREGSELFASYPKILELNADGSGSFSGTVGIGTSTPGFGVITGNGLEIQDNTNIPGVRIDGGSVSNGFLETYVTEGNAYFSNRGTSGNTIFSQLTGPPGSTVLTETVHITNDSNVLIGGTLPAAPNISLNEDGSSSFNGYQQVRFADTSIGVNEFAPRFFRCFNSASNDTLGASILGNNEAFLAINGGGSAPGASIILRGGLGTPTNTDPGHMEFYTVADSLPPVKRMEIDEVGTITVTNSSIGFIMTANPGSGAADGAVISANGSVQTSRTGSGSSLWVGYQTGSSTQTSRINAGGDAIFVGTVTQNASDAKFKDNIADAPSQAADIKALQLRTWNWNSGAPGTESRKARHTMGLVAQEAALVDSDITYTVNAEDSYQAIDHDVLTMKLVGALQEALTRIEDLEARLAAAGM